MQQFNDSENASDSWHFSFSHLNKKTIKGYIILLIALLLYIAEVNFIGFSIPCMINLITGLKCPGCGVTRLIMSVVHFKFYEAFCYNPFIFITSPILLYFCIKSTLYNCGIINKKISSFENKILYVYIALFIVYGIARNIYPLFR